MSDAKTLPTVSRAQEVQHELESAERDAESVLERIRAGDTKVSESDLQEAENRVKFLRTRLEGEKAREAEQADTERRERVEALKERAANELDPANLAKSEKKARAALSEYMKACMAHDATLDEITGELSGLEPLPEDTRLMPGDRLSAGGRDYGRTRPMVKVSALAHEVLREHMRGGYIDLESPY